MKLLTCILLICTIFVAANSLVAGVSCVDGCGAYRCIAWSSGNFVGRQYRETCRLAMSCNDADAECNEGWVCDQQTMDVEYRESTLGFVCSQAAVPHQAKDCVPTSDWTADTDNCCINCIPNQG